MNKPISPDTHAAIDYAASAALLAIPRIFRFNSKTTALMTGVALGHAAYSMLTKYRLGAVRVLPMKGHLMLDGALAVLLGAAGAAMTSERPKVRAALGAIAVGEMATTLLTQPRDTAGVR
jgi:hypothetical protein